MITKREFLKSMLLYAALPLAAKGNALPSIPYHHSLTGAEPWDALRKDYDLKPDYINLENGYYSMMSVTVLEKYLAEIKQVNREGSYYMRTVQAANKDKARERLAKFAGCDTDELIITRNTTESLDTVISGYNWKTGDEAIMAEQDYGSMLDMFRQQAKRFGIVNRMVSVPLNPASDEEVVALYEKAITPATRLIMVCHMINTTGHILPVRKICDMAHARGVEVLVDGAHALAHLNFAIRDLNCDYYGSSLHKWLGVPLGAGLLYVKKENIKNIWPLFAEAAYPESDIRKLNHTGTHPVATDLAIHHALDYHEKMGSLEKQNRLRFLKEYWTKELWDNKNIIMNTPNDPARSCAIANVGVKGKTPAELSKILLDKYKIWTVAINQAGVHGVRITPHLYTTTAELDRFIAAMKEIAV